MAKRRELRSPGGGRVRLRGTITDFEPARQDDATPRRYFINTGREVLALATSSSRRSVWLELPQYLGHEVVVRGLRQGDVIHEAEVSLVTPAYLGVPQSVEIFNRDETLRVETTGNEAPQLRGRLTGEDSGLYVCGQRVAIFGFEGRLTVPVGCDMRYRSGVIDYADAKRHHYGPSIVAGDEVDLSFKRMPRTAQEMMDMVAVATEPSGVDYYLGPWPASNPFALETRAVDLEADRFHRQLGKRRPGARKGGDWERIGEWLNETITNSPKISHRAERNQYWKGARKTITMRRDHLVALARATHHFRERHAILGTVNDEMIRRTEQRIAKQIEEARSDEIGWKAVGAMVGFAGGALVIGGAAVYVGVTKLALEGLAVKAIGGLGAAAGGAVGGVGGWEAGGFVARWARGTSQLTQDLHRLKSLKERRSRFKRERVRSKTLDGIIDVMEDVHGEFRIELDPRRREWILKKAERRLERLMEQDRKGSRWAEIAGQIPAALAARNAPLVGRILGELCDVGNEVRREVEAASDGRVDSLLGGWARGRIADPLRDPDSLWA